MLKLSLTPEMAYKVAEFIYTRARDFLQSGARKTPKPARGKEIGLMHYSLFGKILHDSPWKLPVEELGACITYMVRGTQVDESSVVDYLEFARTVKRKHFDRQNVAELRSADRYYSRINVYPTHIAEEEVCASFEAFRLEEEQRKEEARDRALVSLYAGRLGVNLSEYSSDHSDSDWSDDDDAHESVYRYRYHNNLNKRDNQKSVNMQSTMDIVFKQSIVIKSIKLIEAGAEQNTLQLVEELALKQEEIVASVKETFTAPDGTAPEVITVFIEANGAFPIVTYRMTLEDGSEFSEYIIEEMHLESDKPNQD